MRLESLFERPLDSLMYLERFVNNGSPSGFGVRGGVSSAYCPIDGPLAFDLPIVLAPRHSVVTFGDFALVREALAYAADVVPVPIHPDILPEILDSVFGSRIELATLRVQPTASARTVFFSDGPPFFMKLHYPRTIGRFKRDMPLFKWLGAQDSGRFLREHLNTHPAGLGAFDEAAGVFAGAGPDGFGMMFRTLPEGCLRPGSALVPAFSLFSSDTRNRQAPTLFDQMVRHHNLNKQWFLSNLIEPFLRHYVCLTVESGLIPECNAQNVVVGLDRDNPNIRLYIRDMEDLWKDVTLRAERGLETHCVPYHTIDALTDEDYFARRSFLFDFKLGQYLLDPLIKAAAAALKITEAELVGATREISRECWSTSPGYFDSKDWWYCYPEEASVSRGKYQRMPKPKYR